MSSAQRVTKLIADVDNRARAWRDAARDGELAFRWWISAPIDERDAAAASYLAAIEREEKAADEYSRAAVTYRAHCRLEASNQPLGRNRRRWRLSYDGQ
jgi:hypothetical protein